MYACETIRLHVNTRPYTHLGRYIDTSIGRYIGRQVGG